MPKKKDLGQFFTTNVDYILDGFEDLVKDKSVLDPFAGNGDLLKWAIKNGAKNVIGTDIDQKLLNDQIFLNDSLLNIPHSSGNISNPPYLAKNKMSKRKKEKYLMDEYEDLYLLAIKKIIMSAPDWGILIVPVNFLSSEVSDKLRVEFFQKYEITRINYFKHQVFDDTTYNVISFSYVKKTNKSTIQKIKIHFYPNGRSKTFEIEEQFNYRIGGRELNKITSLKSLKITRLTETHMKENAGDRLIMSFYNDTKTEKKYLVKYRFQKIIKNNIIVLNCIDTNNKKEAWIKAENIINLNKDCLVGKSTSRNIAYIMLQDISVRKQKKIIKLFNKTLSKLRIKYNSLFLTNFRDNDRKRISFDFCYKLITYCHNELEKLSS